MNKLVILVVENDPALLRTLVLSIQKVRSISW